MNHYEFGDLAGFVSKAASYVGYRYRKYGVEREDVEQEINLWLYGDGKRKVERWLKSEPQQTTRIYRSMLDQGLGYAEREKAQVAGYKPEDVWWYTPNGVEGLIPLALDRSFTQENSHVGDMVTMVIDVRKALDAAGLFDWFVDHEDDHEDWRINLQLLVDHLGGERPAIGRRKVLTNATAQAITSGSYDE